MHTLERLDHATDDDSMKMQFSGQLDLTDRQEQIARDDSPEAQIEALVTDFEANMQPDLYSNYRKAFEMRTQAADIVKDLFDQARYFDDAAQGVRLDGEVFLKALQTKQFFCDRFEKFAADTELAFDESLITGHDLNQYAVTSLEKLDSAYLEKAPKGQMDAIGVDVLSALTSEELSRYERMRHIKVFAKLGLDTEITQEDIAKLVEDPATRMLAITLVGAAMFRRLEGGGSAEILEEPDVLAGGLAESTGFTSVQMSEMAVSWVINDRKIHMSSYNNQKGTRESKQTNKSSLELAGRLFEQIKLLDSLTREGVDVVGLRKRFGIRNFSRYSKEQLMRQQSLEVTDTPVTLVMSSIDDHNGALLQVGKNYEELGYDNTVFAEVASTANVGRQLLEAQKIGGPLKDIVLTAHGSREGFTLSDGHHVSVDDIASSRRLAQLRESGVISDDATLVLSSCNTGFEGGPGEEISRQGRIKVFAPPFKSTGVRKEGGNVLFRDFEPTDEGQIQFGANVYDSTDAHV